MIPLFPDQYFTARQIGLLALIADAESMEYGLVMRVMGISNPNLSRAVDSLHDKNYMDRHLVSIDHRKRDLSITKHGSALVRQMCEGMCD
jgi:DNA-binding MarR family transcriptional regulator